MNRIGDLSWFEGPLLTLYEDMQNGFLYLLDWVDRDSEVNRWLIYRAYPADLIAFIEGSRSLSEIFDSRRDETILVADVASVSDWSVYEIENLPESYRPVEGNYFDVSDCPDAPKLRSYLERRAYSNRINELPFTIVSHIDIYFQSRYSNQLPQSVSDIERPLFSLMSATVVEKALRDHSSANRLTHKATYDNRIRQSKRNNYRYA
jgi:hypothetical protein